MRVLLCSFCLVAMESLAERLEGAGSFNIEVVITPLKDLISEAIMEYHGNSRSINDKVFIILFVNAYCLKLGSLHLAY